MREDINFKGADRERLIPMSRIRPRRETETDVNPGLHDRHMFGQQSAAKRLRMRKFEVVIRAFVVVL